MCICACVCLDIIDVDFYKPLQITLVYLELYINKMKCFLKKSNCRNILAMGNFITLYMNRPAIKLIVVKFTMSTEAATKPLFNLMRVFFSATDSSRTNETK